MKTNQEKIAEDNQEARKLGLDYGTYKAYESIGYLDHYRRMKFHRMSDDNADGMIHEVSWIGGGRQNEKKYK